MMKLSAFYLLFIFGISCNQNKLVEAEQWVPFEIQFNAEKSYPNGYTDVDVWVAFINDNGDSLVRPAFWDGGDVWKVRFAPPDSSSIWNWHSYSSGPDNGLAGKKGSFRSVAYRGENSLLKHGLLKMSAGKRNVVHADSTPFLIVGDTPWSIPFRATPEQVRHYAANRKDKGYNTALLISLQPDKFAKGPEARNTELGFDVAFEDIAEGHLNKLKPDYYQTLDTLIQILIDHQLVPVFAPVAHGYGWKGEIAIGSEALPDEYARYCKYLVARYGCNPALWLISLDGNALAPGIKPAGETIEKWDAYGQPTGLHYSPYDDYLSEWAKGDSTCCFHYNRRFQDEQWLDFQWAQTGHDGKHMYHKVERMYDAKPTKANLNGEPTYEGMNNGKLGLGWWQGHDAWMQLMHGGTMGVIYGAASLWQWKVSAGEPGWPEWTDAPFSWREALNLEGSKYVGYVSRAFEGFDFGDMQKRWDLTDGNKPLLAREGFFYISYLEQGGDIAIKNVPGGLRYYWFNPKTGEFRDEGNSAGGTSYTAPDENPWVLIIGTK